MWAGLYLDFPELFEDPAHAQPDRVPDRYGRWGGLVRELSDHDHAKAQRVLRWPLREALSAYRSRMREQALEDYRHRLILWAIREPNLKESDRRPPSIPPILRDVIRANS